jgi:hypothetical protein
MIACGEQEWQTGQEDGATHHTAKGQRAGPAAWCAGQPRDLSCFGEAILRAAGHEAVHVMALVRHDEGQVRHLAHLHVCPPPAAAVEVLHLVQARAHFDFLA